LYVAYFSLLHDEAELINSNLIRGSPSTAAAAAAVVPVDLGEVVQRQNSILPLPTANLSTLTGHLPVTVQRTRNQWTQVL
jgi:hypothetical protein